MVNNPIGRYSIGDRTDGIVYGDDGSLTITIQRETPDAAEAELASLSRARVLPDRARLRATQADAQRCLPPPQATSSLSSSQLIVASWSTMQQ
jgi:hypothetical protein